LKEDLLANPPLVKQFNPITMEPKTEEAERVAAALPDERYTLQGDEDTEAIPDIWNNAIFNELNTSYLMIGTREVYIFDQAHYDEVNGDEQHVLVAMLDDFTASLPQLEKIEKGQRKLAEKITGEMPETTGGKYSDYTAFKAISSGTVFMGLFLGVAILMMMASVLMFKLFASAGADAQRYAMLRKIGVRKSLLTKSIYRELFLIFLFPAIIGLVHVLVGMQMFSFILIDPYVNIWIPISIFLLIYGIYYVLTVQFYNRTVVQKVFYVLAGADVKIVLIYRGCALIDRDWSLIDRDWTLIDRDWTLIDRDKKARQRA